MLDRILFNGVVHTMDKEKPEAQAVGIKDGKICFVGTNEEAAALEAAEKVDLEGKTVLPGFNEGHMHLGGYAFSNLNVKLMDAKSSKEVVAALKQRLEEKPESKWLYGRGWNDQNFEDEKRYPSKEEMDSVSTEIPVIVVRACGHASVVNSLALEKIMALPDAAPLMGEYIHPETGVLNEQATKLFYKIMEERTVDEVEEMLHFGLTKLAECGITCCQSDDLKAIPAAPWRTVIQAYKNLEAKGEMPVRIYEQCLCGTVAEYEEFLAEGHRTGQGDVFKIGPLKLLLDGSLGARTAALTKPYVGTEDQYGILVHNQETMNEFVTLAQKNDMQIAVHCIGDKAMEVTLEAVEVANKAYPRTDCRHGIVHAQLTTKEILNRMAKDEIVAYIQPVFVPTDMDITEARVGYDWMQETYAWKTMNELGILTVGGSDAPVESFDVMDNLYFAVTRQKKNGFPEGGWLPHEKVSAYEAVEMFTTHAAKAMFAENELGQVKEGFKADLVVLAEDVFAVEDAKIKDIAICETIMNGKTTYKA